MKKLARTTYRLLKTLRRELKASTRDEPSFYKKSYSQQGEDMVVNCLFQWNATGFYVDIGAHHPLRYSNTQLFYSKGWRGINIDPNPGIMKEFARYRPNDINLEVGIASQKGSLTYHQFSDPAINTFDEESARRFEADGRFKLINKMSVPTRTLADILEEYLPAGTTIDFMSVDVEGFDETVLRSNNWERFRPRAIIAEDLQAFTFDQVANSELTKYLKSIGYVPISKLVQSVVYCEASRVRGAHDVLIA